MQSARAATIVALSTQASAARGREVKRFLGEGSVVKSTDEFSKRRTNPHCAESGVSGDLGAECDGASARLDAGEVNFQVLD